MEAEFECYERGSDDEEDEEEDEDEDEDGEEDENEEEKNLKESCKKTPNDSKGKPRKECKKYVK